MTLNNETFFSLTSTAVNISGELPNLGPVINSGLLSIGAGSVYHAGIEPAGFQNTGRIVIDAGGTLDEQTSISLSALGSIANAGVLQFSGTLELGGGTMDVKPGTPLANVAITRRVQNGTILNGGGSLALNGATLSAVTFHGPLAPDANHTLTVANGLTVLTAAGGAPGNIDMSAGGVTLAFTDSETLDGVSLLMSNPGNDNLEETNFDQTLALGGNAVLTFGTGSASLLGFDSGDSFENLGRIDLTGGVMSEEVLSFTNAGTIAVGGGAALDVGFGQTFTDTGALVLTGGSIFASGVSIAAGGAMSGFGNVTTAITSDGGIAATGGDLVLAGSLTGTGGLHDRRTRDTGVAVLAAQSAGFAGVDGTLMLDAPTSYSGAIAGFAPGDTIVVEGESADGAAIVGGTLEVTLTGGGVAGLCHQRPRRWHPRLCDRRRCRQHRCDAGAALLPAKRAPHPDRCGRGGGGGFVAWAMRCRRCAANASRARPVRWLGRYPVG